MLNDEYVLLITFLEDFLEFSASIGYEKKLNPLIETLRAERLRLFPLDPGPEEAREDEYEKEVDSYYK